MQLSKTSGEFSWAVNFKSCGVSQQEMWVQISACIRRSRKPTVQVQVQVHVSSLHPQLSYFPDCTRYWFSRLSKLSFVSFSGPAHVLRPPWRAGQTRSGASPEPSYHHVTNRSVYIWRKVLDTTYRNFGVVCLFRLRLSFRTLLSKCNSSTLDERVNTFNNQSHRTNIYSRMTMFVFKLLKTKRNLLYIRNESVPSSKHFPPRL